jgi:DNA-binding NarL/FixJ family response regulator
MAAIHKSDPIRIGLVADEPIRLAGLTSIFDQPADDGHARLLPVIGSISELLSGPMLGYLVIDLHSSSGGLESLGAIHRARPDIRLIVIGPEGDDELVLSAILAGAKAYLDLKAAPEMVRQAIEVVTEGSIWAPRRLLSRLIERLLKGSEGSLTNENHPLTTREHQVLGHIMMARSNREIALHMGIEERTVRAHVGRLMRKAGVDNRIKLSMSALSLSQMRKKDASRKDGGKRAHRAITNSPISKVT